MLLLLDRSAPSYRALVLVGGMMQQVTDAQVGTGLKPVVLLTDGTFRQRSTTEGAALVLVNGLLQTLAPGQTLLI